MSDSLLSYKIDDCVFCPNSDDYFEFRVIINGFKIESKFYGKTYYLYIDDEMIQEWPLVEDDFNFPYSKLEIFSLLEDKQNYFYDLIERGYEFYHGIRYGINPNFFNPATLETIFNISIDEASFIYKTINSLDDFEYQSDFRCCKVGDPKGEAAYKRTLSNGCCGFFDEIIEHPKTKIKYKIGFNYGH